MDAVKEDDILELVDDSRGIEKKILPAEELTDLVEHLDGAKRGGEEQR